MGLNQLTFHPTANPRESSTYRAQNWGIAPGKGSHVAISPKHCIIANTAKPVKVYPKRTERGPARVRAEPIPKNRPVPIVPPRAINWICLDLRLVEVSIGLVFGH